MKGNLVQEFAGRTADVGQQAAVFSRLVAYRLSEANGGSVGPNDLAIAQDELDGIDKLAVMSFHAQDVITI